MDVIKKPRALVTGIKGFTGRYVAAELQAHGWDVFGLGSQQQLAEERQYYCADLSNAVSLNAVVSEVRPDAVVHLAGIAFVGHGDAEAFYRVNLVGTRNLLTALSHCEYTPRCVLLASSANVYGNSTEGVLTEAAPVHPANDYAVSKLAMEHMARLWMDRLPIVLARPFNYTGIGQSESFLLPKIVAHYRHHTTKIELGNVDVWRDFSDVRAVAQAYRRLLEICPAGKTVNVCSGYTRSVGDIINVMNAIAGYSMEVQVNPAYVRSSEVRSLCGSNDLLRRLIGDWETPSLEETLGWMFDAA